MDLLWFDEFWVYDPGEFFFFLAFINPQQKYIIYIRDELVKNSKFLLHWVFIFSTFKFVILQGLFSIVTKDNDHSFVQCEYEIEDFSI